MKSIIAAVITLALIAAPAALCADDRTEEIIKTLLDEGTPQTPANRDAVKDATPPREKTATPVKKEKPIGKPQAPPPDEVLLKTGIQLYNTGLMDAALVKFTELKTKYPQSPFRDSAAIWSGKIHFSENRPAEAIREFSSIGEDSGEYPVALYCTGEALYKQGMLPGAIESFFKTASQYPEHERADDALLFLGNIYLNAKKGNQAIDNALKIIKYYPERETVDDAYYLLAKVFEKDDTLRDFETARKIYRIFLRKADEEKLPPFYGSPLRARVERDLHYIEKTYFKMEN
jgi:TolA-binding protein